MRRMALAAAIAMAMILAGCGVRSISNSGYTASGNGGGNPLYRGELSEFDVLGVETGDSVNDQDIARALAEHRKVGVRKGDTILVVQSGALIPDAAMVEALSRYFTVVPFTGVPEAPTNAQIARGHNGNYARTLRLAAAKAGAKAVLCYWGLLESARQREASKVVSWIPIIGAAIPDETQAMRIRLKVAVVDVATGSWSMFTPEAYVDRSLSASLDRAASDQEQVELLKGKGYKASAETFVAKYAE